MLLHFKTISYKKIINFTQNNQNLMVVSSGQTGKVLKAVLTAKKIWIPVLLAAMEARYQFN